MVAQSEFFRSDHLPVSSTEQNNSQTEEINALDESQAENGSLSVQKAEIRWKKIPWSAVMFVVLSGRSKGSARSPLTVPV